MNPDIEKALAELEADSKRIEALKQAYLLVAEDMKSRSNTTGEPKHTTTPGVQIPDVPPHVVVVRKRTRQGTAKTDQVRAALAKVPMTFSLNDVMAHISDETLARTDVSFILSGMKKKGEIALREEGRGKTAAIYEKHYPADSLPNDDVDEAADI